VLADMEWGNESAEMQLMGSISQFVAELSLSMYRFHIKRSCEKICEQILVEHLASGTPSCGLNS